MGHVWLGEAAVRPPEGFMPTFRCTSCERRVESPVVIGAGDCPHCGGDVVYDIHGERALGAAREGAEEPGEKTRRAGFLRRILGR